VCWRAGGSAGRATGRLVSGPASQPVGDHRDRLVCGDLTVRYLAEAKQGLLIYFFSAAELTALFADHFTPVLPLRLQRTWRDPARPVVPVRSHLTPEQLTPSARWGSQNCVSVSL
jgi:hypothetical protein